MTIEEASAFVVAIHDEIEAMGLPRDFVSQLPKDTIVSFGLLSDRQKQIVIRKVHEGK